jgi:ELWxxDGT repeat protein
MEGICRNEAAVNSKNHPEKTLMRMKTRNRSIFGLTLLVCTGWPTLSLLQADQFTMLTSFGLPKSSSPSQLVDVNGILFFIAGDDNWGLAKLGRELWRSDGTAAGTYRVKQEIGKEKLLPLANVGGTVFFVGSEVEHGDELWKSDGTEAGTVLVKDINPGPEGSQLRDFVNVSGTLFFVADIGVEKPMLWKSDGTEAGTVLVTDVRPGLYSSNIRNLVDVNGTLFFGANDDEHDGLWKSDGTEAGTVFLKDIYLGVDMVNVNGTLFFRGWDDVHGSELWKSDGTEAGTVLVKDILAGNPPFFGGSIYQLLNVNGVLFFVAFDGVHGRELWKSDGTEEGTVLVKDLTPGPNGSWSFSELQNNWTHFVNVNGTLFFVGPDAGSETGLGIWKTDGTAVGTVLVATNAWYSELVDVGGTLFFTATSDRPGLWKSDGTETGTRVVKQLLPSGDPFEARNLVNVNGTLFFSAADFVHGQELWKSDGTEAGTVLVKDVYPETGSSTPSAVVNVNGTLFFTASDFEHQNELWKTDGTVSGTVLVKDINPAPPGRNGAGGSFPSQLLNANGTLFFWANRDEDSYELWKSDGTPAGTVRVRHPFPWKWGSNPVAFTNLNGTVFFVIDDGVHGTELWKSDGTEAGTVLVKDIAPGVDGSYPWWLVNLNGTLFFAAQDLNGRTLWKSDGTEAGTQPVLPADQGSIILNPFGLQAVDGTLYFQANQSFQEPGTSSQEFWKSDGTAAGTVLIQTMFTSEDLALSSLTSVDGTLFFSSSDVMHGRELWKTDGTAEGTMLVKDIYPGMGNSFWDFWDPYQFATLNDALFFLASDGRHGHELWTSDGTGFGTMLLKDIRLILDGGAGAYELTSADGTLFISADDGINGRELWTSDGTEAGTVLLRDINPGEGSSNPSQFVYANGALYFSADDGVHGAQLWKYVTDPFVIELPVLSMARVGNQIVLSWPTSHGEYTLESTTDLSPPLNWSEVSITPMIVGDQFTVTDTIAGAGQFYRLKK